MPDIMDSDLRMHAGPPACPYCNAQFPIGAGGKVACPRCGETVTLSTRSETIREAPDSTWAPPSASFLTTLPASAPATRPESSAKRANRLVAGIVLAVMAVMATTGLTFALKTVGVRREHDTALPPRWR